ncbi:MAG TPA: FtsW/RodA/SpoVE family cell cycle protein [Patescibacteria group bacterium]|nr:FtsW/RodA/SpoVE family cell cycle protein [Patescibacteria group bacterium]
MHKNIFSVDWYLFGPVVVLLILSLTILSSLSIDLFKSQLISVIVGLIVYFIFANLRFDAFKPFSLPIYLGSLVALGVVLLLGFESHGAVRWIQFLGTSIQFSELCKPLLVIALASYLADTDNKNVKSLFVILLLLIPVVLFIYLQPDLGNAIIYIAATFFVLLVFGFRLRWFIASLIPVVLLSPVFWVKMHDYQRLRILTFFHPANDQSGASYNAMQALIAVGSGMFWGRGLSEGTQSGLRFLPERQTDFIFASLTEGLGFVGGVIVLAAFAFLLYRMYVIFTRCSDPFGKVVTASAFILLLIHVFLNIGMNIGLVPIVGVTLPFLSIGGNSLIANFVLLGMVTAVSKTVNQREVLEIR